MRVFKIDNDAFILKTNEIQNGVEVPCSVWIQNGGLEGQKILILKNNLTPIVSGGSEDDYECTIVDLSFNADLNGRFKEVFKSMDGILSVDNGKSDATTWFDDESFEDTDYRIIEKLKELLIGLGFSEDELKLLTNFLENEVK
ncbi:MAG: hypothetical protein ACRCTZ_08285 [Sarcina sp.]